MLRGPRPGVAPRASGPVSDGGRPQPSSRSRSRPASACSPLSTRVARLWRKAWRASSSEAARSRQASGQAWRSTCTRRACMAGSSSTISTCSGVGRGNSSMPPWSGHGHPGASWRGRCAILLRCGGGASPACTRTRGLRRLPCSPQGWPRSARRPCVGPLGARRGQGLLTGPAGAQTRGAGASSPRTWGSSTRLRSWRVSTSSSAPSSITMRGGR